MASIQMDTVSLQFARIKKTLEPDLEEIAAEDASLQDCVHLFVSWDGDCSAKSPGAALFHVFYRQLMVNLLDSELGEPLFTVYAEIMNQAVSPVDQIMSDPGSVWFAGRSRKELVARCLYEAREQLTRQFGRDPHSWFWGGLHTLTLSHPLGRIGPLSDFFCTGPFPAGGDGMTVNNGYYRHTRPYQQIIGPSLRLIVRLDRPIESSAIIAPGQSGHPISPHYRDQMDLWRQGEYVHLTRSEEEMDEWPTMVLNP
jgi:penicillin amidase